MRDERTLTERLETVEKILASLGLADLQDEGDMSGIAGQRSINESKFECQVERAGNTKTEPRTSFEEISNRIQQSTGRVCMIASKLEEIGTRVMGPLNEGEQAGLAGGAERKPDGMLDHTFIALNWLDQALCRLHAAATRIERV